MSARGLELKVGLFMVACIAMAAVLSIRFSESSMGLGGGYVVSMEVPNAGTLVPDANVLFAGVRVGHVERIELRPDGAGVIVKLRIASERRVYAEDSFSIQTVGFLGDQYVSIVPSPLRSRVLEPGAKVAGNEPFSMDQTARSVQGIVQRVDSLVGRVDGMAFVLSNMLARVDTELLSSHTMSNLTSTLSNAQQASDQARVFSQRMVQLTEHMTNIAMRGTAVVDRVDHLLATNSIAFNQVISNLQSFTLQLHHTADRIETMVSASQPAVGATLTNIARLAGQLNTTAGQLQGIIATNQPAISQTITNVAELTRKLSVTAGEVQAAMKENRGDLAAIVANMRDVTGNLKSTTGNLNKVMALVEAGQGIVGTLVGDQQAKREFAQLVTNLSVAVDRFGTLADNLNKHGVLWKGTNSAATTRPPPRSSRPEVP